MLSFSRASLGKRLPPERIVRAMPRITKVYTRGGDDGSTSLGSGQRVRKDDPRVEAYGTVDELNSAIGAARAAGLSEEVEQVLGRIQDELFNLGAELSVPQEGKTGRKRSVPAVGEAQVKALEVLIDDLTGRTSSCRAARPAAPSSTSQGPFAAEPSAGRSHWRSGRLSATGA
jgi:cob(I)alamin adenosyltransferase